MLVDEKRPEKTAILSRLAVQSEIKVRRIGQGRQDIPRCCDQQRDANHVVRLQAAPGFSRKQLPRDGQIQEGGAARHYHAHQSLHQQTRAQRSADQQDPQPGTLFIAFQQA